MKKYLFMLFTFASLFACQTEYYDPSAAENYESSNAENTITNRTYSTISEDILALNETTSVLVTHNSSEIIDYELIPFEEGHSYGALNLTDYSVEELENTSHTILYFNSTVTHEDNADVISASVTGTKYQCGDTCSAENPADCKCYVLELENHVWCSIDLGCEHCCSLEIIFTRPDTNEEHQLSSVIIIK